MRRHSVAFADFAIKNPRSSLKVSTTLLYTMCHLFCGIVLPLSDSFVTRRESESDHTYYLESFLIIQYSTAIFSIFFLQLYIYIYERMVKRNCSLNDDKEIKDIVDDFAVKFDMPSNSEDKRKVTFGITPRTQSDIEIAVENNNSDKHLEFEIEPEEDIVPDEVFVTDNNGNINSNNNSDTPLSYSFLPNSQLANSTEQDKVELIKENDKVQFVLEPIKSNHFTDKKKLHSEISDISDTESYEVKEFKVPFYRDAEGINLYLRLGAVGFGFGVMVHDGFKVADQFRTKNTSCHNALWTPKHCLHLAFIFVQTFFIFKYHRITFQKHKAFVRLILWHLTIINVCQWFKTVVYEINHELFEHSIKSMVNHTAPKIVSNHSKFKSNCIDQLSFIVSPYLFPCAIEYSLISAAIFYKMLQKVGRKFEPSYWVDDKIEEGHKYSECHRSHKGLFLGLLFFMATLVGLAVFILLQKETSTKSLAIIVYQVSEVTLLASCIVALILSFVKMRVLSFRQLTGEEALDDNLLLVGLAGVFAYNLFLFIATLDTFIHLKSNKLYLATLLFMLKSSTEILESILQVLFVLEGSRKYSKYHVHVHKKPGRSFVTFLIIVNLALWIVSIFETKRADQHQIFNKYFQKTPWSIITHTLLPLIIFFRFHSTVCLSDIWSKSYKKRVKHKSLLKDQ